MNNMKQWQQDISNVVDKNSLDIKNLRDNSEVGKLTVRIDNIEAKDREQDVQLSNHDVQLSNHGEQLENLFNKINTDVADTKTEINNTIEQLRLNTNNSITALQTSIDRHTEELDNLDEKIVAVDSRLDDRGIPTGTVLSFAGATIPNGYLLCNGANVSRETYADLFAVIGTTFGSGDGSTTFTLPNLIDKFAQGSTTVGTVKNAGLPNITSSVQFSPYDAQFDRRPMIFNSTGAMALSDATVDAESIAKQATYMDKRYQLNFNASYSSSIYGNSTTVQPPALTLLPCIKY